MPETRLPKTLSRRVALVLAATGLLFAAPAWADPGKGPLVLAAASLQESLNAAADVWAAQGHPRPVISLAASSALARQIEAGAPADLFISADQEWMDHVASKNLLKPGTRADLLTNTLVLIAPAASKVKITITKGFPLAAALDQAKPGSRLATGDVGSVPAGIYTKQALTALGVWDSVANRIAGAASVRAALALVDRGEAPLGVVYGTDAKADAKVRLVGTFPEASHKPIRYPVALLTASTSPEAAGFRHFLSTAQAKAIFRSYGFGTL